MGFNEKLSAGERDPIQIREARTEDVRGILDVLKKTWIQTYPNDGAGISRQDIEEHFALQSRPGQEEKMRAWIDEMKAGLSILVARRGSNVAGFVIAKKNDDVHQIRALYVDPKFQLQGIGKLLMLQALEYLGDEKDIKVEVVDYNTQAIRFYQSFGFEATGKSSAQGYVELSNGKKMREIMLIRKGQGSKNTRTQ